MHFAHPFSRSSHEMPVSRSKTFAIVKARLVVSPKRKSSRERLSSARTDCRGGKDVPIPPDAEVIEGAGLTVYPGFIDAGTSALLDPNRIRPSAGRTVISPALPWRQLPPTIARA